MSKNHGFVGCTNISGYNQHIFYRALSSNWLYLEAAGFNQVAIDSFEQQPLDRAKTGFDQQQADSTEQQLLLIKQQLGFFKGQLDFMKQQLNLIKKQMDLIEYQLERNM